MRSNLEDVLSRRMRQLSPIFEAIRFDPVGPYVIPNDGATMHFLDGGSSNRDVFLPELLEMGGQLYIISNVGASNNLQVNDDLGVLIGTIIPGQSGMFFSSAEGWGFVVFGFALNDGDHGDITVSSGGTVWTIDPNVVTFAKMQDIPTDTLIGRDTAGTGDPESITLNVTLSMTGAGALQRAALIGDVTAPAGSNTTTIANDAVTTVKIINDAVTFAKMQNISTDRLIGRDTAATGDPEEIAVTGGLEFTGAQSIQIANDGVTFVKMQNILTDSLIGRDTAGTGDPENITLNGTLSMTGAGALQREALTGDVIASAGSNTTTIANNVVTYAKMQDIATDSLIGRDTAGTGDPETISLNTTLSMTGAGALQRAALTGDTTASAGSNATVTVQASTTWALTGDISPAQITADQNDYNPTGLSTASTLRLNSDATRNITGLAGGADGRIVIIHNVGAQNIVLTDEGAGSTATNRFALTAAATLTPDTAVELQYDSTTGRWRLIGGTGGGGAASVPSGSLMLFQQTSAPSGWTKQTTHNDKALRVVSGAASSGGTVAFSTVFAQSATGSTTSTGTVGNTTDTGTVGNHTLTIAEMPSHDHTGAISAGGNGVTACGSFGNATTNTGLTGGGGAHNHTLTMNAHNHTLTMNSHTHTMDIRVQFVDLIIASKD